MAVFYFKGVVEPRVRWVYANGAVFYVLTEMTVLLKVRKLKIEKNWKRRREKKEENNSWDK